MNLPEEIKGAITKAFEPVAPDKHRWVWDEMVAKATVAILAAIEASLPEPKWQKSLLGGYVNIALSEDTTGYNQCLTDVKAKLRGGK